MAPDLLEINKHTIATDQLGSILSVLLIPRPFLGRTEDSGEDRGSPRPSPDSLVFDYEW